MMNDDTTRSDETDGEMVEVGEFEWDICDCGHVHLTFPDENGKMISLAMDVTAWLEIGTAAAEWLTERLMARNHSVATH